MFQSETVTDKPSDSYLKKKARHLALWEKSEC